ncbi:MAG: hypothetical protein IID17_12635 [Nitrospinae bacterium]|nr:hypothetical protein [Nitrospinota bacterium]
MRKIINKYHAGSFAEGARSREGEIAHAVQCFLASVTLDPILTGDGYLADKILYRAEFFIRAFFFHYGETFA